MDRVRLGTFIATALTAAAVLGGLGLTFKLSRDTRDEIRASLLALRESVHAEFAANTDRLALSSRRGFDHAFDTCGGTEGGLNCTFTNTSPTVAATICVRATVANKESSGIRLTSMPLCSGRVPPGSTVSVQVDWNRGRPSEICNSPSSFGGKQLDWSKCALSIDDLPAETIPTPAASAQPPAKGVASAEDWKAVP